MEKNARHVRRVRDLRHALAVWTPGAPPALTWLLSEVRDLLDSEFVGAYRPTCTDRGWAVDFMYGAGPTAPESVDAFRGFVSRLPASDTFLGYSPFAAPRRERNRVVTLSDLDRLRRDAIRYNRHVLDAVGVGSHDQLRVLLCRGPRVDCWLGATRPERFRPSEAKILGSLAGQMHRRLRFEQKLLAPTPEGAVLEIALDALDRAAFVVDQRGTIQLANRRGLAALQREPSAVMAAIRASERTGMQGSRFSLTRVRSPGWPDYVLAIENENRGQTEMPLRLEGAQRKWGLTVRQTRVLETIATGATNKEIALALECAEVTVENHLTAIYRRSGARSRVDLIRRLFSSGE